MTPRGLWYAAGMALSLGVAACGDALAPAATGVWAQVAAGDFFSCGLTRTGRAYCWGAAIFGQLGNDDTRSWPTPVAVAGGHHFSSIAVGSDHACALEVGGKPWCWGLNDFRELGAASSSCNANFVFAVCARQPLLVSGSHSFDSIVVSGYASCGLEAGAAWCWGWNSHGQVGSSVVGSVVSVPAAVAGGRRFSSISLDLTHVCGLDAGNALYCWGSNIHGQLAADTLLTPRCGAGFFCAESPVPSAAGLRAVRLSAGGSHTCALTAAGDALCWGSNQTGALGNSAALGGRTPVAVSGGHVWNAISAGEDHTCALEPSGAAWCWGINAYGQLGVASVTEACPAFGSAKVCSTSPVAVAGAPPFAFISAGSSHTCALTAGGEAWCWGRGSEGQLGDGRSLSGATPVRVMDPEVP